LPYFFVALACLIVLLHRRDKLSFHTIQTTIIALTLVVFPYLCISQAAFANSGNPWIPFYGFQVVALVIAGFRYGNGVRLNAFLLAAITIQAAVFWWVFHL